MSLTFRVSVSLHRDVLLRAGNSIRLVRCTKRTPHEYFWMHLLLMLLLRHSVSVPSFVLLQRESPATNCQFNEINCFAQYSRSYLSLERISRSDSYQFVLWSDRIIFLGTWDARIFSCIVHVMTRKAMGACGHDSFEARVDRRHRNSNCR